MFNGKLVKLAGVYSIIKSGFKNKPQDLPYGKILIIDTGSGVGFGHGSGIIGTLKSGADSIYAGITDIGTYRDVMKGGILHKLGDPLFQPDGPSSIGVSEVIYARAATTVAAEIDMTGLTNGGFIIQCRDEGTVGNGVEGITNTLTQGYAVTLTAGVNDPTKYVMSVWRGTYTGLDSNNGVAWDGVPLASAVPEKVAQSPEVSTVAQLITYMQTDAIFNLRFALKSGHTATGNVVVGDLTTFSGNTLASGGTETYASGRVDEILENIDDLDYSMILCDKWNTNSTHAYNSKLIEHVRTGARFEKHVYIGGGNSINEMATYSIAAAQGYNDDYTHVVHGACHVQDSKMPLGYRYYESIYKTAAIVGRVAGLPPQVPLTFKRIKISGEEHKLTKKEKISLLDSGVIYTYYDADFKGHVVGQGVNTLQDNENLINDNGTSHSIQVRRITAQMNKEIEVNAKKQLLGDPNGVNVNTLSPQIIKDWLAGYLKKKVAKPESDNLIVGYETASITVLKVQDAHQITYGFYPNTEINKLFITGFMLN